MNSINFKFMKITKLLGWTLCTAVLVAFCLVGCEESNAYQIDAPSDIQDRIDSIAAANDRGDTGDTTYIDISTSLVGAEDYSSAWWVDFSDYFAVPTNQLLHVEFINHNGGATDNYKNWVLAVTNEAGDRDADDYSEYFVLRSDAFGWGNDDYDGGLISNDYPDTDGDDDVWNDFRTTMDGATVSIEIDHSATGYVFVTATAVGTNGTEITETYQHPVSASLDINAFFITEACYLEMQEAYLIPSKVTAIEDVNAASISIEGTPTAVEQSEDLVMGDFWGDGIATITFEDGSSTVVDTADVSFSVIPDMTTLGEKTIIATYSKTKQGEYGPAVSTVFTVEVTNPVTSLELTTLPETTTYAFYGTEAPAFDPTGMVITATYSDGTTGVLDNSILEYEIPLTAGAQNAVISYVGATSTVSTTFPITVIEGTNQVGAIDFTTGFWGALSADYSVASNTSETITFYTYSDEGENWHCPITVLRNTDYVNNNTEYAVTRWDNAGWGDYGIGTATLTSDWNWDIFLTNISGSKTVLTVTNNGDNTADLRYDVTYPSGETHYQLFEGITVDSSDLNFAVTVENCYHIIVE